jgi:hypothetical protein
MKVPGYNWATCINVNDEIVHSIPKGRFQVGDMSPLIWVCIGITPPPIPPPPLSSVNFTPDSNSVYEAGQRALRKAIKAAGPVTGSKIFQRHSTKH